MKLLVPAVEILEPRVAPASVLTFTDVDGDKVKITSSLGDLTGKALLAPAGAGEQLQTLDLTDTSFQGAVISITTIKAPTGDGFVNVGYINATGVDLKSVLVKGDLGQIDAGDADQVTPALAKLTVRSIGVLGLATQAAGSPSLRSDILGPLGSLAVQKDVRDAFITVQGPDGGLAIGQIAIGGSLIGGAADSSGHISVFPGDIGLVKIGGDIVGAAGPNSGVISSFAKLGSVTVRGSLVGGDGPLSGRIRSDGDMGKIKIGGNIIGGDNDEAGSVLSRGNIVSVQIGGSIFGGAGVKSGRVWTFNQGNDIGLLKMAKDLVAGAGNESGTIIAGGKVTTLTIGGSVLGGDGEYFSGQIGAAGAGSVSIRGDIRAGDASNTAQISIRNGAQKIFIGGSVVGGPGTSTSMINTGLPVGSLMIKGSVVGLPGSPAVIAGATLLNTPATAGEAVAFGSMTVGGDVKFARIIGFNGSAQIGAVKVGGDWIASSIAAGVIAGSGGFGTASDFFVTSNPDVLSRIASITIKGIVAGSGAPGDHFGFIARTIGKFTAPGVNIAPGPATALELSLGTGDVTLRTA